MQCNLWPPTNLYNADELGPIDTGARHGSILGIYNTMIVCVSCAAWLLGSTSDPKHHEDRLRSECILVLDASSGKPYSCGEFVPNPITESCFHPARDQAYCSAHYFTGPELMSAWKQYASTLSSWSMACACETHMLQGQKQPGWPFIWQRSSSWHGHPAGAQTLTPWKWWIKCTDSFRFSSLGQKCTCREHQSQEKQH